MNTCSMYICIPTQIWKHTYHMYMSMYMSSAFSLSDELCIFVFVNACVLKEGGEVGDCQCELSVVSAVKSEK